MKVQTNTRNTITISLKELLEAAKRPDLKDAVYDVKVEADPSGKDIIGIVISTETISVKAK